MQGNAYRKTVRKGAGLSSGGDGRDTFLQELNLAVIDVRGDAVEGKDQISTGRAPTHNV